MAFFLTANGSFAGRCEKSSDLILSKVINWNQLEKKRTKILIFFKMIKLDSNKVGIVVKL